MDNNKQNSIEQKAFKSSLDYLLYYLPSAIRGQFKEQIKQAKAMHKEEIVKAYNRDVINKKQNWAIENGERYYNLHYKEEQVGESSRENQLGKTNPDYTFEDGV